MRCVPKLIGCCVASLLLAGMPANGQAPAGALPRELAQTGLYAPGSVATIHPDNVSFSPQYPLWSDGAAKRRWLYIPPGTFIDATRPDAWEFPRGTKAWKEFSQGRRVETRFIERLDDGTFRYATYVWNEEGTQALLAPAEGIRALPVPSAPGGRYVVPSEPDCRACHESAAAPLLGVSALQLSPDRDPLAPHAEFPAAGDADLHVLSARGWLRNLPETLREVAPRIEAPSPESRAALGYLHGNCGHCHNDNGSPAPVDLVLAQSAAANAANYESIVRSLTGKASRYRTRGLPADAPLVDAGRPDTSVLVARMRSRDPMMQMPPLGTRFVDAESLKLIEQWIALTPPPKEMNR